MSEISAFDEPDDPALSAFTKPKPPRRRKISDKVLGAALRDHGGIKVLAANSVGLSRVSVHWRIENSPYLQAIIAEVEEETLDIAEGHITAAVRRGDRDYVRYYADRKGRKRGYGPTVINENRIDDTQLEALVLAFGGDVGKLRELKAALDPGYSVFDTPQIGSKPAFSRYDIPDGAHIEAKANASNSANPNTDASAVDPARATNAEE